jgi:hypothetical protein
MMKDQKAGKLLGAKKRHPAYKDEEPIFAARSSMFKNEVMVSQGVFAPRQSFLELNGENFAILANKWWQCKYVVIGEPMGLSPEELAQLDTESASEGSRSPEATTPRLTVTGRKSMVRGRRVSELADTLSKRMSASNSASFSMKPRTTIGSMQSLGDANSDPRDTMSSRYESDAEVIYSWI